jgi:hypothetical protein
MAERGSCSWRPRAWACLTPGSRVGARSDDLHLILQHQPEGSSCKVGCPRCRRRSIFSLNSRRTVSTPHTRPFSAVEARFLGNSRSEARFLSANLEVGESFLLGLPALRKSFGPSDLLDLPLSLL